MVRIVPLLAGTHFVEIDLANNYAKNFIVSHEPILLNPTKDPRLKNAFYPYICE